MGSVGEADADEEVGAVVDGFLQPEGEADAKFDVGITGGFLFEDGLGFHKGEVAGEIVTGEEGALNFQGAVLDEGVAAAGFDGFHGAAQTDVADFTLEVPAPEIELAADVAGPLDAALVIATGGGFEAVGDPGEVGVHGGEIGLDGGEEVGGQRDGWNRSRNRGGGLGKGGDGIGGDLRGGRLGQGDGQSQEQDGINQFGFHVFDGFVFFLWIVAAGR